MRKQQGGYGQGANANCFSQSNCRAFGIFDAKCLKAGRCIFLEWLWRNWEVLTKVVNDGRWTLIYTFTLFNKPFYFSYSLFSTENGPTKFNNC